MEKRLKDLLQQHQPAPMEPLKEYAVLLPLIDMGGQWQIVYEVRSEWISQPGEVSFPGGRIEEGESPQQAALRETEEELGLQASDIDLLGELDYIVNGQRKVHGFVGILRLPDLSAVRANDEVARVFTVPVEELQAQPPVYYSLKSMIDPTSDFPFEKIRGGVHYPFSAYKRAIPFYEGRQELIWGMTAQFTERLMDLLDTKN